MSFFNKMYDLLQDNVPMKIVLSKNGRKIVVSVIPDVDDPDIQPGTISGTPDEVDQAFFSALSNPIEGVGIHLSDKMLKTADKEPASKKKEEPVKDEGLFAQQQTEKPKQEEPAKEPAKEPVKQEETAKEQVKQPEEAEQPPVKSVKSGVVLPGAPKKEPEAEPEQAEDKTPWSDTTAAETNQNKSDNQQLSSENTSVADDDDDEDWG